VELRARAELSRTPPDRPSSNAAAPRHQPHPAAGLNRFGRAGRTSGSKGIDFRRSLGLPSPASSRAMLAPDTRPLLPGFAPADRRRDEGAPLPDRWFQGQPFVRHPAPGRVGAARTGRCSHHQHRRRRLDPRSLQLFRDGCVVKGEGVCLRSGGDRYPVGLIALR
jgi:hypothetical protein